MTLLRRPATLVFVLAFSICLGISPDLAAQADLRAFARKPDAWFRGDEGKKAVANVISNQSPRGDWPKGIDTASTPYTGDPKKIQGTFDNGATVAEVRFLAKAFGVTHEEACRVAVLKAIDHILQAQYPTGGWPQFSPPGTKYHRYITFNDDTMVNLMELLRDVESSDNFAFVDVARRRKAHAAFDAGIACILKCQVVVDGKKTVWCAQHDEKTLAPRPARTFEPVSLSGSESVGILMLLMSLDQPSNGVIEAVDAGVRWFESAKIRGIRQQMIDGDKVIISDPNAPPLWARFCEIGTNRPMFLSRDGVVRYSMSEISAERRNGYSWYGTQGTKLLQRYDRWKQR